VEFFGHLSFLKGGIHFADRVTTVSPTHARELQTLEMGYGLDGVLRSRGDGLLGILNGVDYTLWDPRHDAALDAPFCAADLAGKRVCKAALQRLLGLPERPRTPLCGAVSRLTDQKGFDLVAEALEPLLVERDLQVVILGAGEPGIEDRLARLAERHPTRLAVRLGHDETLAHRIYAGTDLFLMPSRYEPCGLGQLYALRYGTVPIVRTTGGLDDTVVDYDPLSQSGTGFKFATPTADALATTWRRALTLFANDAGWTPLLRRGMAQDFSWHQSARSYQALYRGLQQDARPEMRKGA
jgi:starch synthase